MLIELINSIDEKKLYMLLCLLVVLLVVSFVKKLVKTAIFIVVICILTSASIPAINNFKANFGISINGEQINLKIKGEDISLTKDMLESIKIVENEDGSYTIDTISNKITVPKVVFNMAKDYMNNKDIKLNVE